jgi:hypothetical protein
MEDQPMRPEKSWTLMVMASRNDGAVLLLQPVSGVHAHVQELLDSDMALLEFTVVVPLSKAEELLYASAVDESQEPQGDRWQFVPRD